VPQVTESRPLAVLESDTTPGWGSSGYYPAPVLEAAGKAAVFPAGTQMYLDHPSWSEAQDRPERSVRDLAAVLTGPASWDDQMQALVAEAQVFAPYRDMLTDPGLAQAIGVSIRANAVVEQGEAEGRTGTIVSELVEGVSVDFVTQAGRGGRILSVLESARPQRVVERADARVRSLEESAGRVQALEAERDAATQRANAAESQLAQYRVRDAARPVAAAIAAESELLTAAWQADVVEAALTRVPLTSTGELDEAALRLAVETERTRQETRAAELLEAKGAGRVRGNGERHVQERRGKFDLTAAVAEYRKTGV
jgi:hypothetical protein